MPVIHIHHVQSHHHMDTQKEDLEGFQDLAIHGIIFHHRMEITRIFREQENLA